MFVLSILLIQLILVRSDIDKCNQELVQYMEGFLSLSPETSYQKMAYYSGRRLNSLGDYDGCIKLDDAHYITSSSIITTMQVSVGLCIPKSCTKLDILYMLQNLSEHSDQKWFLDLVKMPLNLDEQRQLIQINSDMNINIMDSDDKIEISTGTYLVLALVAFLFTLVSCATVYDMINLNKQVENQTVSTQQNIAMVSIQQSKPKVLENQMESSQLFEQKDNYQISNDQKLLKLFLCFSAYTNFSKLTISRSSDRTIANDTLQILNGIRVMSMGWVVLGHFNQMHIMAMVMQNPEGYIRYVGSSRFGFIYGAFFAVDTFFWMSGFLMGYLLLTELYNKTRLNWLQIYAHRFIRLLPVYTFALLVFWKLLPYFGDGPNWGFFQNMNGCDDYWWTNLLFINNVIPDWKSGPCMGWTWYMANDMQLFCLGPVILWIYYKYGKYYGWSLVGMSCLCSFLSCFILVSVYDISMISNQENTDRIYTKPYCRVAPYAMGIFCGIILNEYRYYEKFQDVRDSWALKIGKQFENKYFRWASFIFGILIINFLIFGQLSAYQHVSETRSRYDGWPLFSRALFKGIMYPAYGLAISLIFLPLLLGHFRVLISFLSWEGWNPFAKLTYCCYLVHPMAMGALSLTKRGTIYVNDSEIALGFITFAVIGYIAAIPLTLLVESPILGIEKVLLTRKRQQQDAFNLIFKKEINYV